MSISALDVLDIEELIHVTRWQIEQAQFGDALVSIKHAMQRDDHPDTVYSLAGKIYAQLGLMQQAKQAFEVFLKREPDALNDLFQYGMVHYENRELDKAISIWNQVLDKNRNYPPALFYSALAYANGHDTGKALKIIDQLIKSAPADNLYVERGQELKKSINSNTRDAKTGDAQDNEMDSSEFPGDHNRTIN